MANSPSLPMSIRLKIGKDSDCDIGARLKRGVAAVCRFDNLSKTTLLLDYSMFRIIVLCLVLVWQAGCSDKAKQPGTNEAAPQTQDSGAPMSKPQAEAPVTTLDTKGSLLREGLAACIIVYPEPGKEGDWLAMMKLEGAVNTDRLPRIPLSTSSTLTLLNIPPGKYIVRSKAWLRKSPPYAGGTSAEITLNPGELTILRASLFAPGDPNPEAGELIEAGRKSWTIGTPSELPHFVSQTADAVRG
ncbi:MAG: hypothetical protein IPG71_10195 [bacterium]|nr:hypothetical protein [bacterium]